MEKNLQQELYDAHINVCVCVSLQKQKSARNVAAAPRDEEKERALAAERVEKARMKKEAQSGMHSYRTYRLDLC